MAVNLNKQNEQKHKVSLRKAEEERIDVRPQTRDNSQSVYAKSAQTKILFYIIPVAGIVLAAAAWFGIRMMGQEPKETDVAVLESNVFDDTDSLSGGDESASDMDVPEDEMANQAVNGETDADAAVSGNEESNLTADVSDDEGNVPAVNQSEDAASAQENNVTLAGTDYVLPNSSSSYVSMDELEKLSAQECRIARNELYARHGRMFEDQSLQTYFDSKSWYHGRIAPSDFPENLLNAFEAYNRDLIVRFEIEKGYR